MAETTYEVVVVGDAVDQERLEEVLKSGFPQDTFIVRKAETSDLDKLIANQVRNKLLFGP